MRSEGGQRAGELCRMSKTPMQLRGGGKCVSNAARRVKGMDSSSE